MLRKLTTLFILLLFVLPVYAAPPRDERSPAVLPGGGAPGLIHAHIGTVNQVNIVGDGTAIVTFSTPQDIDTDADVEFDSAILDDLTALRLVATDALKKLISTDLFAWVAGTVGEIDIADDGDGTITISLAAGVPTAGLGDLVAGSGMTGGGDNVLVGPDADTTVDVIGGDGMRVTADEVEVFGLVASDGTPNDAAVVDAVGMITFNYDATLAGTDPALIFDGSTAGDTDFWMGITADEVGDDNDKFQIGDGLVKGTNPFVTILTDGKVGINKIDPPNALTVVPIAAGGGLNVRESDDGNNAIQLSGYASRGRITLLSGGASTDIIEGGVGDTLFKRTGGNIGVTTGGPDRRVDILDASDPQLRLTHTDGTVYVDFQTDGSGDLAILPSGDKITLSVGTKHDGFVIRNPAEVQTLDAVQTTLDTITLLDENVYTVQAFVAASQSDGTDEAGYIISCVARRTGGGGATVSTTISQMTDESNGALDATFTVNGNDLRLSVTGIGAETWEWGTTLKYMNMSN